MTRKNLDKKSFDRLVQILVPHMYDLGSRRALVDQALFGCDVLDSIDWSGPARTFTINLLRKLLDYGECVPGEPGWATLARDLRRSVGSDKQEEIDELLRASESDSAPTGHVYPAPPILLDPELYVFISYARPDQEIAEQVEAYLLAAGVRVFRDTNDIRSGANWDMTIEKALNQTHRMVLILSDSSMPYRKEVHREWFFYDQESKPLHPLYVKKCRLHSRMYAYNYIDARADFHAAMRRLRADLGRPFEPPAAAIGADRILVLERDEGAGRTHGR